MKRFPHAHDRRPVDFITPRYLLESDYPWLRALVDEFLRFVGRRRRDLDERLRDPLPVEAPEDRLRAAVEVLKKSWADRCVAPVPPRRLRAELFREAALAASPEGALRIVAKRHGTDGEELLEALFADVPEERLLLEPEVPPSPAELAVRVNLHLVQRLLARSDSVEVELEGSSHAVVRYARLRGLICTVRPGGDGGGVRIFISGPYSIFRRTRLYGRALAGLVPRLKWCNRFELRARCVSGKTRGTLLFRTGDPVLPAKPPRPFDSELERRFARDFGRLTTDWHIIREPQPVRAGDTLIFPDFALEHRLGGDRWIVEIIGFWTADYVENKLRRLRQASIERCILLIDNSRNCADDDLPAHAHVLRFRRRVDVRELLTMLERERR